MSNLGHLGIQPKEQEENAKKLLIGDRIESTVKNIVSSIPDNKVTRGIGTGLKFVDMAINRNPGIRLYNQAENTLLNVAGQGAKKFGINPFVAQMGLGMMIPGPGEGRVANKLLKSNKGSKLVQELTPNRRMITPDRPLSKGLISELTRVLPKTDV